MEKIEIFSPEFDGPLFSQKPSIQNSNIRGLAWWQPFGTLMLHGKIETRHWPTRYRGLILICTTKKAWKDQPAKFRDLITTFKQHEEAIDQKLQLESLQDYPTFHLNGFAIAVGTLADCRKVKLNDNTYFAHTPGLYAHVYKNIKRIEPFPIVCNQGLFTLTPKMKSKIKVLD